MAGNSPTNAPNRLIFASGDGDANMLWATSLFTPDPYIYFTKGTESHVVMSDLEVDRARTQARVDHVLSLTEYVSRLQASGTRYPTSADVIQAVLRRHRLRSVHVPANFPLGLADDLRKRGIGIRVRPDPFWSEREFKTRREVGAIAQSLAIAEEGMAAGREALRRSSISRDGTLVFDGAPLTSERLKAIINARVIEQGAIPSHTIVASGPRSADPHDEGGGAIRAHEPVIIDIFPRSVETGYFGDMTRTFVRGRAPERLRAAYDAVSAAQDLAIGRIRDGTDPAAIHEAILSLFRDRGFETGQRNGRMEGFFHGTGHGLGLDIHEIPTFGLRSRAPLRAGHVVTVEPGLYYRDMGGVRLEDVVRVGRRNARNLVSFPRKLEL